MLTAVQNVQGAFTFPPVATQVDRRGRNAARITGGRLLRNALDDRDRDRACCKPSRALQKSTRCVDSRFEFWLSNVVDGAYFARLSVTHAASTIVRLSLSIFRAYARNRSDDLSVSIAAEQQGDYEAGRQLHGPFAHHRQGWTDDQTSDGGDRLPHSLSRQ